MCAPRIIAATALAFLLAGVRPCFSQTTAQEYEVKAAFIYNFTQFVTWPTDTFSDDQQPFIIALIGDDPFNGSLQKVFEGKSVSGRHIIIKHFNSVDQIENCQLLFVPQAQDDAVSAIFAKLGTKPILTVGESDKFIDSGGCIRLFLEDSKMRFEIDLSATDAARLKPSSKLIKLAKIHH